MANYTFRLHPREGLAPFSEELDVDCDEDAEDLAKVTLLSMTGYTRAEVYRGGKLVAACQRDDYSGLATRQAQ